MKKKQLKNSVARLCGSVALCLGLTAASLAHADSIDVTVIGAGAAGNPFFNPIVKGTEDAAAEFGVDVDFQYADLNPSKLNDIILSAVNNQVDGIVVQMYTPGAYRESLQAAHDAGITVISYNIDDPTEAPHKFVGQDLEGAGYKIAKYLIAEANLQPGDHVVSAAGDVNASDLGLRYKGVERALVEAGLASELIAGSFVAAEAQTLIAQYLVGRPDTAAVIGLDAVDTGAAPAAVRDANLEIPTSGFDVTPIIVENIREGVQLGTIDQQPYLQGYLPVMMIAHNEKYGLSPYNVDTGDAIIERADVDLVEQHSGSYR